MLLITSSHYFFVSDGDWSLVVGIIQKRVTVLMNEMLLQPLNIEEIRAVIFQMHPDKIRGLMA